MGREGAYPKNRDSPSNPDSVRSYRFGNNKFPSLHSMKSSSCVVPGERDVVQLERIASMVEYIAEQQAVQRKFIEFQLCKSGNKSSAIHPHTMTNPQVEHDATDQSQSSSVVVNQEVNLTKACLNNSAKQDSESHSIPTNNEDDNQNASKSLDPKRELLEQLNYLQGQLANLEASNQKKASLLSLLETAEKSDAKYFAPEKHHEGAIDTEHIMTDERKEDTSCKWDLKLLHKIHKKAPDSKKIQANHTKKDETSAHLASLRKDNQEDNLNRPHIYKEHVLPNGIGVKITKPSGNSSSRGNQESVLMARKAMVKTMCLEKKASTIFTCLGHLTMAVLVLMDKVGVSNLMGSPSYPQSPIRTKKNREALTKNPSLKRKPGTMNHAKICKSNSNNNTRAENLSRCAVRFPNKYHDHTSQWQPLTPCSRGRWDWTCTAKALQSLKASLQQEFHDLHHLVSNKLMILSKQVELRQKGDMKCDITRDRWKQNLGFTWEVCNNLSMSLIEAQHKLAGNEMGGKRSNCRRHEMPYSGRKGGMACHLLCGKRFDNKKPRATSKGPKRKLYCNSREETMDEGKSNTKPGHVVEITGVVSGKGENSSEANITTPKCPTTTRTVVKIPGSRSDCMVSIKTKNVPRLPPSRKLRNCLAAQHAAFLQHEINRLRRKRDLAEEKLEHSSLSLRPSCSKYIRPNHSFKFKL